MATKKLATQIRKLHLEAGDILVIERGFNQIHLQEALQRAGREARINFTVPYIFVDDINKIAVLKLGIANCAGVGE